MPFECTMRTRSQSALELLLCVLDYIILTRTVCLCHRVGILLEVFVNKILFHKIATQHLTFNQCFFLTYDSMDYGYTATANDIIVITTSIYGSPYYTLLPWNYHCQYKRPYHQSCSLMDLNILNLLCRIQTAIQRNWFRSNLLSIWPKCSLVWH